MRLKIFTSLGSRVLLFSAILPFFRHTPVAADDVLEQISDRGWSATVRISPTGEREIVGLVGGCIDQDELSIISKCGSLNTFAALKSTVSTPTLFSTICKLPHLNTIAFGTGEAHALFESMTDWRDLEKQTVVRQVPDGRLSNVTVRANILEATECLKHLKADRLRIAITFDAQGVSDLSDSRHIDAFLNELATKRCDRISIAWPIANNPLKIPASYLANLPGLKEAEFHNCKIVCDKDFPKLNRLSIYSCEVVGDASHLYESANYLRISAMKAAELRSTGFERRASGFTGRLHLTDMDADAFLVFKDWPNPKELTIGAGCEPQTNIDLPNQAWGLVSLREEDLSRISNNMRNIQSVLISQTTFPVLKTSVINEFLKSTGVAKFHYIGKRTQQNELLRVENVSDLALRIEGESRFYQKSIERLTLFVGERAEVPMRLPALGSKKLAIAYCLRSSDLLRILDAHLDRDTEDLYLYECAVDENVVDKILDRGVGLTKISMPMAVRIGGAGLDRLQELPKLSVIDLLASDFAIDDLGPVRRRMLLRCGRNAY